MFERLWQQLNEPMSFSPLWLFALFFAGFFLAFITSYSATSNHQSLVGKLDDSRAEVRALEHANELLQIKIDESAQSLKLLREDLAISRKESLALERENTFFKGLVSPEDLKRSFKLHRFELVGLEKVDLPGHYPTANGERYYSYEAIVAHVGGRGKKLSGKLSLDLSPAQAVFVEDIPAQSTGADDGDGEQLVVFKDKITHKLGFQFFQRVTGRLKLPADFDPDTINVWGESNLSARNAPTSFEIAYRWPDVLESGGD